MGLEYQTAVRVSAGFGGGMYLGSACGAVTGAILAIGLKYGGVGMQSGVRTARLTQAFAERFKATHGSINCTELLGGVDLSKLDFDKPEVFRALLEKNVFAVCPGLVRDATQIVDDMLHDAGK
jgi:C_GCAxxG_C_C family probable redox protein